MNQEEKIKYLNSVISRDNTSFDAVPSVLYKYRSFDNYSFDMLDNSYVYLCAADNLDDETECDADINIQNYYEMNSSNLKRECIDQIVQLIRPYTTKENYEIARSKMYMIAHNGKLRSDFILDYGNELKRIAPSMDTVTWVNMIINIPEKLDEPTVKSQIEKMISLAANSKKQIGICSLSESCDIDYMWNNYADNENGYCIEYDLSNYELNSDVLPVLYKDEKERQTNIVIQIIASFLGTMITSMTNGKIKADNSQYASLFLTKNLKWSYQKEWRIIGNAGDKARAPKIKRIILGKNVTKENAIKMAEYCGKNDIEIIERH